MPRTFLFLLLITILLITHRSRQQCSADNVTLHFEQVVFDIDVPTFIKAHPTPGNDSTMFIGVQSGVIYVVDTSGTPPFSKTVYLNITDLVIPLDPSYDERGLLSMAFHPDYLFNGIIYVWYSIADPDSASVTPEGEEICNNSRIDHINVLEEYQVDWNDGDPFVNASKILFREYHPFSNHNGLQNLAVRDRQLYLATGDGGLAYDPFENAQNHDRIQGKVMRFDIDALDQFNQSCEAIVRTFTELMDSCPDVGNAIDVITIGIRNPSGVTFVTNNRHERLLDTQVAMILVDVGQNTVDEVNVIREVDSNLGWDVLEGTVCVNQENDQCPNVTESPFVEFGINVTLPFAEVNHDNATLGNAEALIGGDVFTGTDQCPQIRNQYIFGDYTGKLYYIIIDSIFTEDPVTVNSTDVCNSDGTDAGTFLEEFRLSHLHTIHRINITTEELVPVPTDGSGPSDSTSSFFRCIGIGSDSEIYVGAGSTAGPEPGAGGIFRSIPNPEA